MKNTARLGLHTAEWTEDPYRQGAGTPTPPQSPLENPSSPMPALALLACASSEGEVCRRGQHDGPRCAGDADMDIVRAGVESCVSPPVVRGRAFARTCLSPRRSSNT